MDDAGSDSPDSGYRSSSPQTPPSIIKISKVEAKWKHFQTASSIADINVTHNSLSSQRQESGETVNSSRIMSQISEQEPEVTYPKINNKNNVFRNSDGKISSCFLSATDSGKIHKKRKLNEKWQNGKRRRPVKAINMEEENSSPVLGIRILPFEEFEVTTQIVNETKNSLHLSSNCSGNAKFVCRLCCEGHDDAVSLAQHKCARIINLRYDCEECGKTFGCPANLASHKRWHKPKNMETESESKPQDRCNGDGHQQQQLTPFVKLKRPNALTQLNEVSRTDAKQEDPLQQSTQKTRNRFVKAIYACQYCSRRYRRDSNRLKHVKVVHGIPYDTNPHKKTLTKKKHFHDQNANFVATRNLHQHSDKTAIAPDSGFLFPYSNINSSSNSSLFRNQVVAPSADDVGLSLSNQLSSTNHHGNIKYSLSALALAAEVLATGDMKKSCSTACNNTEHASSISQQFNIAQLKTEADLDLTKPLDLSAKRHAIKKPEHSIEELTKPRTPLNANINSLVISSAPYHPTTSSSLYSSSQSVIPEPQIGLIPPIPPINPLLLASFNGFNFEPSPRWSITRTRPFQDYPLPGAYSGHYVAPSVYRK